jgi:hypothetical protein
MKYYVSVGPGGVFFRVGMLVNGIIGSLVYWRATRRRGAASKRAIRAGRQPGPMVRLPEIWSDVAPAVELRSLADLEAAMAAIER